jgi:hypothetical protein
VIFKGLLTRATGDPQNEALRAPGTPGIHYATQTGTMPPRSFFYKNRAHMFPKNLTRCLERFMTAIKYVNGGVARISTVK